MYLFFKERQFFTRTSCVYCWVFSPCVLPSLQLLPRENVLLLSSGITHFVICARKHVCLYFRCERGSLWDFIPFVLQFCDICYKWAFPPSFGVPSTAGDVFADVQVLFKCPHVLYRQFSLCKCRYERDKKTESKAASERKRKRRRAWKAFKLTDPSECTWAPLMRFTKKAAMSLSPAFVWAALETALPLFIFYTKAVMLMWPLLNMFAVDLTVC